MALSVKKYELIIFDCDGTLVDSELLTNRVIAEMIRGYGLPMTTDKCMDLFAGKTIGHITDYIKAGGQDIDEDDFETDYRKRCESVFRAELAPIPGVKDLVTSLQIDYCVASNGPKVKMDITLPSAGLQSLFEGRMYSAYDIQAWKPKPDLFLHVCEDRGIHPTKTLVIEDTWSGAMAAVNGGIDVWVYNAHMDTRTYIDGVPNFAQMQALHKSLEKHL